MEKERKRERERVRERERDKRGTRKEREKEKEGIDRTSWMQFFHPPPHPHPQLSNVDKSKIDEMVDRSWSRETFDLDPFVSAEERPTGVQKILCIVAWKTSIDQSTYIPSIYRHTRVRTTRTNKEEFLTFLKFIFLKIAVSRRRNKSSLIRRGDHTSPDCSTSFLEPCIPAFPRFHPDSTVVSIVNTNRLFTWSG